MILTERREMVGVDAEFRYYGGPDGTESVIHIGVLPAGGAEIFDCVDARTVRVRNGWPEADRFDLDVEGFAVAAVPTSFTAWFDQEAVARDYYPECVAAACAATGATRGVIFDHNVRSGSKSTDGYWSRTVAKPTRGVHNDYTDRSAPTRAAEVLGETPAGRYAYVNLWRPISEPLRDSPLAVCDGRTLRATDLCLTELRYPERSGWIHRFRYSPEHRWTYFPEMLGAEVLFLKCWDSAQDGRTRHAAHSAFTDPTTPPGSPPRESIEVRVLLVWD